jgi:hypothetical protein
LLPTTTIEINKNFDKSGPFLFNTINYEMEVSKYRVDYLEGLFDSEIEKRSHIKVSVGLIHKTW